MFSSDTQVIAHNNKKINRSINALYMQTDRSQCVNVKTTLVLRTAQSTTDSCTLTLPEYHWPGMCKTVLEMGRENALRSNKTFIHVSLFQPQ